VNEVTGEPDDESAERTVNGDDPVLRDVIPYCSDPDLVRKELHEARMSDDPVRYLEGRLAELEGSRSGDIRILLNRLERSGR